MTLRDEIYKICNDDYDDAPSIQTTAILAIFKERLEEIQELAALIANRSVRHTQCYNDAVKIYKLCTLDESEPTRTSGIGVAEDDEPIFNAYEYVKLMQKMFPHEKPSEMRKKIEKAFEEYGESADDEKLRDKIRGELNMLSSQVYSLDNCSVIGGLNTVVEPCVDHIMAAIKEARDG
jgi:hypothetical protein